MDIQEALTQGYVEPEPVDYAAQARQFAQRVDEFLVRLWPNLELPLMEVKIVDGIWSPVPTVSFEIEDGMVCHMSEYSDEDVLLYSFNNSYDVHRLEGYTNENLEVDKVAYKWRQNYHAAKQEKDLLNRRLEYTAKAPQLVEYDNVQQFIGQHAVMTMVAKPEHLSVRVANDSGVAHTMEFETEGEVIPFLDTLLNGDPYVYGSLCVNPIPGVQEGLRHFVFTKPATMSDDSQHVSVWVKLFEGQANDLETFIASLLAYYKQLLQWAQAFALELDTTVADGLNLLASASDEE